MIRFQLATVLAILCVALLALTGRIPYVVEFRSLWRRAFAALLLILVLAAAAFQPLLEEPAQFNPGELWFPLVFLGHAVLTVFLFLWWRLRGDVSLREFLSLSGEDLGSKVSDGLWYGAGCWVFAIAASMTMGNFAETVGGYTAPTSPPPVIVWMAELSVARKLAIVVMSMTVEEAFYRGFLQSRIGLMPSSILFAMGHYNYDSPFLVVGVFAVSLVIGRCFERTRDLLPCMIAHAVFNGVQLMVVLPFVLDSWGKTPG